MHGHYQHWRRHARRRARHFARACAEGRGPEWAWAFCEAAADSGPAADPSFVFSRRRGSGDDALFGGGGLGVRRPLRFLAFRLGLSREQVADAAKVLERLKTERAQASVDLRRAASEMADALESEEFGRERAQAAAEQRVATARLVQEVSSRTLEALHDILDEEQRLKLASMIRSGEITL